jgi:hypothetical protein
MKGYNTNNREDTKENILKLNNVLKDLESALEKLRFNRVKVIFTQQNSGKLESAYKFFLKDNEGKDKNNEYDNGIRLTILSRIIELNKYKVGNRT